MTDRFLAYAMPDIGQMEIDAVSRVMRSGMLTTGPAVDAFEEAFAGLSGAAHAVSCCNGTAALHLVAMALDVGPACSVVVPSVTFLATANGFRIAGAEIVFADVDPDTGLMTAETARHAVARATRPVRAIVPVHLGGRLADLGALARVAEACGAALVEDACHAVGSRSQAGGNDFMVGDCRHSRAAIFSLHPTKTITAGEGGVITTRDAGLAERLRLLRNHGMTRSTPFAMTDIALDPETGEPNPWFYEMRACGLNYRLSDIHAAIGYSQIQRFDSIRRARHAVRQAYDAGLADLQFLRRLEPGLPETRVDHLYQISVDFAGIGVRRAALMNRLREMGIGTQVHYTPLHRQAYYRALSPGLSLPGTDAFYETTLSLPYHQRLTTDDAARVVAALREAIAS